MKINKVSKVSFKRGIDNHIHRGYWWSELSEKQAATVKDELIKTSADGKKYIFRNANGDMLSFINKSISKPEDKIDKIITSNLDCMVRNHPDITQSTNFENGIPFFKDEIKGNLELLESSVDKNEFLYLTGQPGFGNAKNLEDVLSKDTNKFVGIKLHPAQLNIKADDIVYEPYMQFAQKHKLPVLFHSQVNVDWNGSAGTLSKKLATSDPEYIYNLAKKFPDVPVIMGHGGAGGVPAHKKAIDVLTKSIKNKDANLYCDISWMDFTPAGLPSDNMPSIMKLIKTCKEENQMDRILFGSDVPVGIFEVDKAKKFNTTPSDVYSDMVKKLKTAIKKNFGSEAEEITDKIFYKNADELFFNKKWAQNLENINNSSQEVIKKLSKTKLALGIGALTLGFMGIAYFSTRGKHEKTQNSIQQQTQTTQKAPLNTLQNWQMPSVFQKFAR